ncbi:hypothetical protein H6P81_016237 [Aristolochia fimbriata]|uniref:Uncharacterized protein n=1 Tax=Aristolochia fimbriata TaxID=158543 RepID=A0AAV7EBI5_ARIFI|nr:hypothetical protein H6P81_016237 [Aristolochia fimbriata]
MAVVPSYCHFDREFVFEHGNVVGYSGGTTGLMLLEPTCSFNTLCTMLYNVTGWNPHIDHISIWTYFSSDGQLFYALIVDDMSLESGLGMMYIPVLGEGAPVEVSDGAFKGALTEWDERGGGAIVEYIPKESGEDSWPEPVSDENVEEEVEIPLPNIGVPPLEDGHDVPYPDTWIGEMDMNAGYMNTMIPTINEDNVPPPVDVQVGQRFMRKDALQST